MPRYWVERYVRCTQRKRKWQLKKTAYNEAGLSEGMDGHTVTRTRGGRKAAARCARSGRAGAPSAAEVAPWSDGALVAPQVAARSRNDCATAGASATRCMHISISTSSGVQRLGRGKMASTTHAPRIEPNTSPFAISATLINRYGRGKTRHDTGKGADPDPLFRGVNQNPNLTHYSSPPGGSHRGRA